MEIGEMIAIAAVQPDKSKPCWLSFLKTPSGQNTFLENFDYISNGYIENLSHKSSAPEIALSCAF